MEKALVHFIEIQYSKGDIYLLGEQLPFFFLNGGNNYCSVYLTGLLWGTHS